MGARRQHGRPGGQFSRIGAHNFPLAFQLDARRLFKQRHRAETFRALLHTFAEFKPVDPVVKAGIIVHAVGRGHLPSRGYFFQHGHRVAAASAI